MRPIHPIALALCLAELMAQLSNADTVANQDTQADKAFAKYGLTGRGVIVAILDRGIDYTHADFRNTNGTTRIRMMWDFSNANPSLGLCDPAQPAPNAYIQSQINNALSTNTPLGERDAVGHGTVTAGIAAGNGRAALPKSLQWAGFAPQADLVIVKITSEGAPTHSGQPAESPFQGCYSKALDLVMQEAVTLREPVVALINSGTQWGPIDGTSAVSQKIDADFGLNNPGFIYVEASGDEGTLANHSQATYSNTTPAVFDMNIAANSGVAFQMWYTGGVPGNVTITANDTHTSVTAPINTCQHSADNSIQLCQYAPGNQFYPWTSSGPDRAVWFFINGHVGTGTISIQGTGSGTGTADAYGDASPIVTFTDASTVGRLTDYSSSHSAIVAGCYNLRTSWTDINGNPESLTTEGATNALWEFSSGGPTRDGRSPLTTPYGGVDITTPAGNIFAAYSTTSYWGDRSLFSFNLIQGGNGFYGRQSATSGASPILQGTVALMLQMNPKLTATTVRQYIHQSAISDTFTGTTPNLNWGTGKVNVLGALDLVAAAFDTNPALSSSTLSFPPQTVGTTSAPETITFSNNTPATDPLGITTMSTSGDFHVASKTCGSSLPAGKSCTISVTFKPTKTGTRNGTLTIKDFNVKSPHTVALSGTGQ